MQTIRQFLLALTVCAMSASAVAAAPATATAPAAVAKAPRNGAEYLTLPAQQPVPAGKKIEVIEFFSYTCPHCRSFDPALEAWAKKNADKVVFRRVHVAFNPIERPLQRMYAALESMGMTERMHPKVFAAIHEKNERLFSDQAVIDFVARNGVDKDKFTAAYNAFDMQARVGRANSTIGAYAIDHWPALAVNGRYLTSPSKVASASGVMMTPEQQQMAGLAVVDYLVAQARSEQK